MGMSCLRCLIATVTSFLYLSFKAIDFSKWNSYAEDNFVFCDRELVSKCREPDPVSHIWVWSYVGVGIM